MKILMENWLYYYQHLPGHINPVAFKIGIFSINWYSIGYLVGFFVVYSLLKFRIKKGEFSASKFSIFNFQFSNKFQIPNSKLSKKLVLDFMFYAILGVLVGGRLGYVLFYNLPYYLAHPLEIFLPIQAAGYLPTGQAGGLQVTGIYGMSYHGGLLGVILASYIFSKKRKFNFWKWADFVVPAIPAGYFFGRIGNFLNGELYGRATEKFWGMYFPVSAETQNFSSLQLRHPSQLYEAFFEGLVLFIILWALRNGIKYKNKLFHACLSGRQVPCFALYVMGYGIFRLAIEFFREPDPQIGLIFNFLTLGQLLSLAMVVFGVIICFARAPKNRYNEANG